MHEALREPMASGTPARDFPKARPARSSGGSVAYARRGRGVHRQLPLADLYLDLSRAPPSDPCAGRVYIRQSRLDAYLTEQAKSLSLAAASDCFDVPLDALREEVVVRRRIRATSWDGRGPRLDKAATQATLGRANGVSRHVPSRYGGPVKSLRLDPNLERRLHQAAAVRGESLSEFIRRAAAERAEATLSAEPADDFSDVVGVVHGGGGRARRTGEAFTEELLEPATGS